MRYLAKITTTFALALVFSAGMAFGQSNTATVNQVGDSHSSDIHQDGDGNATTVKQLPDTRASLQDGNEASVFQRFDNNEAQINQTAGGSFAGNPSNATADVVQKGNYNFLDLDQGAFYGDHSADIDQLGNNNTVRLRSSNGGGVANVYFDGNRNRLSRATESGNLLSSQQAVQKNRGNLIDVDVEGSGNKIGSQQQNGDGGHSLTVDITGDNNFVPTFQDDNGGLDNSIDITANGSSNYLEAVQDAADNTATITLNSISDDNQVVVDQQTSGNTATVTVDGMNNTATVCQASTCN